MVRSPLHDRLYVAAIEVGGARPFYVLGDASAVAPADWLIVESQGGAGGSGLPGTDGMDGAPGGLGCPGQPGFPGWSGSAGGAGGTGGSGGRFTVIVPEDQRFLAKLGEGLSWGGCGGPGGSGGGGGGGGKGGPGLFDTNNQPWANRRGGACGCVW